jgi:hypothetical protein
MSYSIIQPPFALKFREMAKKDLVAYRDWFHAVMPERLEELSKVVRSTPGFEGWQPDYTPASLNSLGEWFRGQVEMRARTAAEVGEIRARLTFPIEVPNEELTDRSFSLAADVGMYFGQVIIQNLPGTRWDQALKNPKMADYGQPVIVGFGPVSLNPVRIAVTLAYALAAKEQTGERLRALFEVWSTKRA